MDKWKTICSQALLDTKWVKVRKDAVELPNGQHIDDFYAITINEAAAIVALDDYGNIILKKEYRHCYGRDLIEIPAGGFERGEEGLEVAKRELLEETGYVSDDWQFIGKTVESSAKLTNYMHIYFADHCRKVRNKKCLSPAKKYKLYKSSINKSIHFVQRSLSSSTRVQRVTAQRNLSRRHPVPVPGKKV